MGKLLFDLLGGSVVDGGEDFSFWGRSKVSYRGNFGVVSANNHRLSRGQMPHDCVSIFADHRQCYSNVKIRMSPHLAITETALSQFCAQHHIRRLSLFGSVLKGIAQPDSDIDLLVEFESEATPTLLDLAGMEEELSILLDGRRVDLRTAGELSRYFRDEVLRQAEVQYVSGG